MFLLCLPTPNQVHLTLMETDGRVSLLGPQREPVGSNGDTFSQTLQVIETLHSFGAK